MKPSTHFYNGRPGLLGAVLACACVLSLGSGSYARAEEIREPKAFKLQATVVERSDRWPGARATNHDPFWSHDGIGDGQTIAIREEKKSSPAQEPPAGPAAETQAKQTGAGTGGDKEKSEPTPPAKKSDAPSPSSTDSPAKTEAPATPAVQEGSVSTVAPTATPASRPRGKGLDGTAVDWSQWANELADRWYKNLVVLERKSGKGFNTLRPAKIRFTCYPDGSIKKIAVFRSCGIAQYDRMQIEALKKAQPLIGFPAGTKKKSITMLQGWESRKKQAGEKDFELGSYGKKMPVERVRKKKSPTAKPAPKTSSPKPAAKTSSPKPGA